MTFFLACLRVLLNAPLLTPPFSNLTLAFSSYFNCFPDMFEAKTSIKNVSSCVLVKLLFSANIFTIGSFRELFSQL